MSQNVLVAVYSAVNAHTDGLPVCNWIDVYVRRTRCNCLDDHRPKRIRYLDRTILGIMCDWLHDHYRSDSGHRTQDRRHPGNIDDDGVNAVMIYQDLQKYCKLGDEAQNMLKMAISELNFSARAYDRILKVSRKIADLDSSEEIRAEHVSEAIQYRTLDRQLWA